MNALHFSPAMARRARLAVVVAAALAALVGCERKLNAQANDTAASGPDLTNSTRAGGRSNLPQPSSTDNPAPGVATVGPAAASDNAASQSVSSQTTGTRPMANAGSQPSGSQGATGAGGGKQP